MAAPARAARGVTICGAFVLPSPLVFPALLHIQARPRLDPSRRRPLSCSAVLVAVWAAAQLGGLIAEKFAGVGGRRMHVCASVLWTAFLVCGGSLCALQENRWAGEGCTVQM